LRSLSRGDAKTRRKELRDLRVRIGDLVTAESISARDDGDVPLRTLHERSPEGVSAREIPLRLCGARPFKKSLKPRPAVDVDRDTVEVVAH
jgi:hypothetical protein